MTDAIRRQALGAADAGDGATAADERLRWTSVPRWAAPELPAAAFYLACWFGPAGRRQARALLSAAPPGVPVRTVGFAGEWDSGAEAELARLIDGCFTGARIILAGPEAAVMRAVALARRLGAVGEELVLIATDAAQSAQSASAAEAAEAARPAAAYVDGPADRRVFCAACRQSFGAVAALGDVVTCPGCAKALIVDHRFSRSHAAYFGWPAGLDLHR